MPVPFLRAPHLMTMAPVVWPRRFPFATPGVARLFDIEEGVQILARCHWQSVPREHPTLVIVHGLEGSAEATYVMGVAYKAFALGFNAIRLNLRNCGGTMHLAPTLYNAGLSQDIIAVVRELQSRDRLQNIFLSGYSLGGNIILKAAGELAADAVSAISGVAAVCPAIDLELVLVEIEKRENRMYEQWFLRTLKQKIREKSRLFPALYDAALLDGIRTLREFDDVYTAPNGGYGNAANYYERASAKHVLANIQVPTMIVAAQDDPMVPFGIFKGIEEQNRNIRFIASKHGGHAGFVHCQPEKPPVFDRFWAENRIVAFCAEVMSG